MEASTGSGRIELRMTPSRAKPAASKPGPRISWRKRVSEERHYADLGLGDAIDDLNSIRELAADALRIAGEEV